MIVVTGANGHLGRQIVEGLASQLPSAQVVACVRDPAKAADLTARGIQVRQGDFADPATLAEAFRDTEQVLIVSVNVLGEEAVRLHGNAIQAARDAGAKRILYTSHQCADPASLVSFGRDHAATEALLRACGVPFVSLRNGFYAESALYQLGGLRATGRVALPPDGPVSWTARGDLAEAAVAALTRPALFDGITPPLTATEALRFDQVAALASEILGRDIARVVVEDDPYREGLLAHGFPPPAADMLVSLFAATRAGEFDVVDPALERVLGRRPVPMRLILEEFLSQPAPPTH